VLELFQTSNTGAEQEIASQQARIASVRHEQQKAKEAYYHDAMIDCRVQRRNSSATPANWRPPKRSSRLI
jgi:hypothetical protein